MTRKADGRNLGPHYDGDNGRLQGAGPLGGVRCLHHASCSGHVTHAELKFLEGHDGRTGDWRTGCQPCPYYLLCGGRILQRLPDIDRVRYLLPFEEARGNGADNRCRE